MSPLKLKSKQNIFTLVSQFDDWNDYIQECKDKLKILLNEQIEYSDKNHYFHLYFSFNQSITEDQLIDLLNICELNHILFLGFGPIERKKQIQIIYKIYPGDDLEFYDPVLIMDHIGKDITIKAYDSITVNGIIQGTIDLVYSHCTCTSLGFKDAKIRIYDLPYQNLTNFSSSYVYYHNHEMIIQKEVN